MSAFPPTRFRALAGALFALGLSGTAHSQEISTVGASADSAPQTVTRKSTAKSNSRILDPDDGQFDVSSVLEHAHGFLPIPLVVTEPAVGYGGGAVAMFVRPREEAGQEGWSRPNLSAVGGLATENGTWMAFGADSSRWLDGRLQTTVAGATGKINLDFYGAGLGLPELDQAFRYSLDFTGAIAQANWKVAPRSPWAAGLRYVYADIDPQPRDQALAPALAQRVKVSAPTAIIEYDSRDNVFTPSRGIYSETSYLISRDAFGASVEFERFQQTLLAWKTLPHDITLGGRADYAWSSADTPFYLRPYIQLRGVPAVRYQGDQVASFELEARWQFLRRWSVVPFAGFGSTHLERSTAATDGQSVASGGIGFRYELARKFGLHAGLDVAHSPGTTAIYLQVGNAWFRP